MLPVSPLYAAVAIFPYGCPVSPSNQPPPIDTAPGPVGPVLSLLSRPPPPNTGPGSTGTGAGSIGKGVGSGYIISGSPGSGNVVIGVSISGTEGTPGPGKGAIVPVVEVVCTFCTSYIITHWPLLFCCITCEYAGILPVTGSGNGGLACTVILI